MHLGWWFLLFDKFRVISWRVSLFVNNEGRILAMIIKCLYSQSDASITMQWPMRGFIGRASLLMLGIWRASACYEYFRGWGDAQCRVIAIMMNWETRTLSPTKIHFTTFLAVRLNFHWMSFPFLWTLLQGSGNNSWSLANWCCFSTS